MKTRLDHVAAAVFGRPWLIREDVLQQIGAIVEFHLAGGRLTPVEIQERLDVAAARNGPRDGGGRSGPVQIIPIYGLIAPRATLMTDMSGGSTVEGIRGRFRAALGDEGVGSILFDVDSPGGSADGIEELAAEIFEARGQKPMAAIARYGMASAAYYTVSGVDEIIASPSSMVGWIGTAMIHTEYSKMAEMIGETTTIVRDPKGKMLVNSYEPLTEEALAELQQVVGDYTGQFHSRVAKGRGVSVATVKADFGGGGGMTAARAKAAGLVDRVETIDVTVARMTAGKLRPRGTQALAEGMAWQVIGSAATESLSDTSAHLNQGGDASPADDPEASVSGEAGTPPEDLDEIALERAIASRRPRSVDRARA